MTIELDPSQKLAVQLMVNAPFCCVTGGAGVGKTTSLAHALDELDRRGQTYRLAAPTGKAAKRMTEATGRPACTIHRLLAWRGTFQVNRESPLQTSCVIIDEASMLDIELGAALLSAIDERTTRLVLMGDANQLPPVGPGYCFGDIIASGKVPVARLTTLHRAAALSWMSLASEAVLRREMPDLAAVREDFRFVEVEDSGRIMEVITDLISRASEQDMQVLIPQKPGVSGILEANLALQRAVNPRVEGVPVLKRKDGSELRPGDRVIQTRNDYDIEVFNGEIGHVTEVGAHVLVHFADRGEVKYSLHQAGGLQLAYALTVHKMQGSEFPWIVFVCHSTHTHMLSPQLIYTALTRGKKGVIIVGNEKGMRHGLRQDNPPKRNTGLVERLNGSFV